jgi:hypothetical protein
MEDSNVSTQLTGLRVKHVANRMLISTNSLVLLLERLGFNIEHKGNFELSQEHLNAFVQNYIRGVHHISSKTKTRIKKGKMAPQAYINLFYFFLKDQSPEGISLPNAANWELDNAKIEDFCYRLIFSPRTRTDKGSKFFNKVIRYVQARLLVPSLDFKLLLLSIISPMLFFNYPSDEDHHVPADQRSGFSVVNIFFMLEAFVNQFNAYTRNLRDEKNSSFNTENTRMQLVC